MLCTTDIAGGVQARADSPERFRVEIHFSNGTNYTPGDARHAVSTKPRVAIHRGDALSLSELQAHLGKWGSRPPPSGDHSVPVPGPRF